jgi:hypothetical protein
VSSVRDGERQCQRAARAEQGRAGGGAVRGSRQGRAGDGAARGGEAGEGRAHGRGGLAAVRERGLGRNVVLERAGEGATQVREGLRVRVWMC